MSHANPLPAISAGIINYNGRECVVETIRSILNNGHPVPDVIMVDDCSTDDSVEMVKREFPSVRVFVQPKNMGPNAARNRILREAKNDIVFVTDNDVTLALDCLALLVDSLVATQGAGATTPMVLDSVERDKIYSNGAGLHFACFGMLPMRHERIPEGLDMEPRSSVCGSGGIMLVDKASALAIGGFDEDFYFGYDDGEFTYRITASGRSVIQVPRAKIYHIEKPGRRTDRLRFQIRGRWDFILKNYAARTLVLLAPALLVFEIANVSFLASKGLFGEWMKGLKMILGNMSRIMEKRSETQSMKKRPDRELLASGEIYMFPSRLGGGIVPFMKKVFEGGLSAYFALVRPLLSK
ncbi:MAG: glycosyltransferase [Nitrospinae bacterium]|nr:glycosyltransferase [Nitrospinota bacterium]